jgi:hypothetical protein
MISRFIKHTSVIALCIAGQTLSAQPSDTNKTSLLYRQISETNLPSTASDWDYAKMEPNSNRLFIARMDDGLTVFDVDTNQVIGTVANSTGANGPLLLPEYNRGYVAMTDGSLLSFELDTLKYIDRIKLDEEGLNSGVYDPSTRLIHFITGTGQTQSNWYSLDAKTGKLIRKTTFPFKKMDDPAIDGQGFIYAPVRYDDIVLKLESKTLKEVARWPAGCHVSKMNWVKEAGRLVGACLSDAPSVFVMHPKTGAVTARVPIGSYLDGIGIDTSRRRIVTSSSEGRLDVIGYDMGDKLTFLGSVSTEPEARMSAMDHRNGRIYVVNARFTATPDIDGDGEDEQHWHPDSFSVKTFEPE